MEDVKTDPVDQTQDASGVEENQQSQAEDVVKYESYKKVLSEAKSAKEKARQLEAELEAKRQAELEAKGNYQEIIDSLKRQKEELETKYRTTVEKTQWERVTGSIKNEAVKAGCLNPDKLIRLLDKHDFETLRAEDGEIRAESLNQLLEKAKRENDFLFKRGNVQVNDAVPANNPPIAREKSVSEMSKAERIEALKKSLGQVIK